MRYNGKKFFLKFLLIQLERFMPLYLSIKPRAVLFTQQQLKDGYTQYTCLDKSFAILMQGPLNLKDDFTYQTLCLYKHIYPNIIILLSTWNDQDRKTLDNIKGIGVEILTNNYPEFNGTQNINFQLTTTSNGLNYLKKENVGYVLKTRTDQRCYGRVDFLAYFNSLLLLFPLNPLNQQIISQRLLICSINTFAGRLYGVSDMFMFGTLNDMLLYWDIPLQTTPVELKEHDPVYFIKNNIAEGYLVNHFFKKMNFMPTWLKHDSDMFFNENFIIVNKEQIDLFWLKYERYFESWPNDSGVNNLTKTFADWILTNKLNK